MKKGMTLSPNPSRSFLVLGKWLFPKSAVCHFETEERILYIISIKITRITVYMWSALNLKQMMCTMSKYLNPFKYLNPCVTKYWLYQTVIQFCTQWLGIIISALKYILVGMKSFSSCSALGHSEHFGFCSKNLTVHVQCLCVQHENCIMPLSVLKLYMPFLYIPSSSSSSYLL